MGAEVVLLLEPGGEGKRRAHGGQLQEGRRRPSPQPPQLRGQAAMAGTGQAAWPAALHDEGADGAQGDGI